VSTQQQEVFVFIGPPGSGKGSLSGLCVQKLGWEQLSTGNLCRKHIAKGTKIGKEIDFAIKSGKLVSDGLITSMVEDWFSTEVQDKTVIILDGYPRTVTQAKDFNEYVKSASDNLKLHVIRFSLSDDEVIARLSSRYICKNKECQAVYSLKSDSSLAPKQKLQCDKCDNVIVRRKDDNKNAVEERLKVYHRHEKELLNFYKEVDQKIDEIDVEKPLNQVFDEFKRVVGLEKYDCN